MRDEIHMNAIRITLLVPSWGGYSTTEEAFVKCDSIVNNLEAAGLYAIISYHGTIQTSGEWEINNFWSKAAQRYKDKTFVIFNLVNEQVQCFEAGGGYQLNGLGMGTGNPAGWLFSPKFFGDLHKAVRQMAPNTMIWGIEPVNMECDWSPWLKTQYAPYCGFTWTDGKNAFSFHPYNGTVSTAILTTQAGGVPIINSEYSYGTSDIPNSQEWGQPMLEGVRPVQFFEKYGISHFGWQEYHPSYADDNLYAARTYLLPDALAKGYAWWTFSTPSAPTGLQTASSTQTRRTISWTAPTNLGGGLMRYLVYRNGVQIGRATGTTFTDSTLQSGVGYRYEVSTLGKGSLESVKSLPLDIGNVSIRSFDRYQKQSAPAFLVIGKTLCIKPGEYALKILEASGRMVMSQAGAGPARYDLPNMGTGVYLVVFDQQGMHVRTMIGMSE
jgi:hypothetical protein